MLQLVAGSLQSGFSLPQALAGVVRQDVQPAAAEIARALAETRIGVDLEVALDRVADRMQSPDLRWTVMAVRIQRETGGNLAEVLLTTMGTMRERAQLRRHVRALSAEGRLSAAILLALPVVVAAWLFLARPGYMEPLYTTAFGLLMVGGRWCCWCWARCGCASSSWWRSEMSPDMLLAAGLGAVALAILVDRGTVDEVRTFVTALVQAGELGISIARVLREQAHQMRLRRRQRAEGKAQQVPVKILFPLISCLFPALFVVVIGPGAISIMESLFR